MQFVFIVPVPLYARSESPRVLSMSFKTSSCDDTEFNDKKQELMVVRTTGDALSCLAMGNLHIKVIIYSLLVEIQWRADV